MGEEFLLKCLLIAIFSIVQSIFGMGILVFGTPTFLLLGHDFLTTLSYLIPASLAVSIYQTKNINFTKPPISKNLYYITAPCIILGLLLSSHLIIEELIIIFISIMLIISAVVKLGFVKVTINLKLIRKISVVYHFFTGLIHGLTNLGGGLLTLLSTGKNDNKVIIRYRIAHYYLIFTSTQLIVLLFLIGDITTIFENMYTCIISLIIASSIGNKIFEFTNNKIYNVMFAVFMLIYSKLLILKYIFIY